MYIELHARSAFSFLEGASVPEEFAEVCAQQQMPAMALLDRDGVYGAPRFYLAAKKLKLRAHIGAEITSLVAGCASQKPVDLPRLALLCASRDGYQNLCRLITCTKLRGPKHPVAIPQRKIKQAPMPELLKGILPQCQAMASLDDLTEHAAGLICLTGGDEGPLANALERGGAGEGRKLLEQLITIYGRDNVYVELQRHYDRAQEARNQGGEGSAHGLSSASRASKPGVGLPSGTMPSFACTSRIASRRSKSMCPSNSFTL